MVDVASIIVSVITVASGILELLNLVSEKIKTCKRRKNRKQLQSKEDQKVLAVLEDIYEDLKFYNDIVRDYHPETGQDVCNMLAEIGNHQEFEKEMKALGENLNFYHAEVQKMLNASSTPDHTKVKEIRRKIDRSFKTHLYKALIKLGQDVRKLMATEHLAMGNNYRAQNVFNVVVNIQNANINVTQQLNSPALSQFTQRVNSNVRKIANYSITLTQPGADDFDFVRNDYNDPEGNNRSDHLQPLAGHRIPTDAAVLNTKIINPRLTEAHYGSASQHRQLLPWNNNDNQENQNINDKSKVINVQEKRKNNDKHISNVVLKYKGSTEKEGREVSAIMGNRSIFYASNITSEKHQIEKAIAREVIFYMEVELVRSIKGPDGWAGVGIGLVAMPEKYFRSDRMPGWYKSSLGYDGRLGKAYCTSAGSPLLQNCGLLRKEGDKVGLGVRLVMGGRNGRDVEPELYLVMKDGVEVTKATERNGRPPFLEALEPRREKRKSWFGLDVRPVIGLGSAGAAKIKLKLKCCSGYNDWFQPVTADQPGWENVVMEGQ